jgi:hypothetical protein
MKEGRTAAIPSCTSNSGSRQFSANNTAQQFSASASASRLSASCHKRPKHQRYPAKVRTASDARWHFYFLFVLSVYAVAALCQSSRFATLFILRTEEGFSVPSNSKNNPHHYSHIKNTTERVIFYNIYLRTENEERKKLGLSIVQQQLAKKSSFALAADVPVYYTLIAQDNATDEIQRICGETNNTCHPLKYIEQGGEDVTLQSLWNFCKTHPTTLVTYIHNKGSFHPSKTNYKFRLMLTKGALSNECQSITTRNTHSSSSTSSSSSPAELDCNICGARFAPTPHFHMTGNMWTAQCHYVNQLLPPNQFAARMDAMLEYILSHATNQNQQPNNDNNINDKKDNNPIPQPTPEHIEEEWVLGLKRYAMEHWLGSHPTLKPCDVQADPAYVYGRMDLPKPVDRWHPTLQRAPWRSLSHFRKVRFPTGEWFCGTARLVEFQFLYGQHPPSDSFVWEYYANATKDCPIPIIQRRRPISLAISSSSSK